MSGAPGLEELRPFIQRYCPELSKARFALLSEGWNCLAIDVDDRWIFKFPRSARFEEALLREAAILRKLRPRLTMPVPDLVIENGPPLFSRHRKIPGEHLLKAQLGALTRASRLRLASDLAGFFAELFG